ncbi:hypothetical protein CDAR_17031 [Caerostris darwini]|uniref:Uncharacterized protein n=1 Tax=Caerostris darwini TaxID=1538125 RepID=A0AAV4PQ46_9ARAC|nr:hypothetical protein CDAR_17031 [Caerostris darwini]
MIAISIAASSRAVRTPVSVRGYGERSDDDIYASQFSISGHLSLTERVPSSVHGLCRMPRLAAAHWTRAGPRILNMGKDSRSGLRGWRSFRAAHLEASARINRVLFFPETMPAHWSILPVRMETLYGPLPVHHSGQHNWWLNLRERKPFRNPSAPERAICTDGGSSVRRNFLVSDEQVTSTRIRGEIRLISAPQTPKSDKWCKNRDFRLRRGHPLPTSSTSCVVFDQTSIKYYVL